MAEQTTVPVKAQNGKVVLRDSFSFWDDVEREMLRFWERSWPFGGMPPRRPLRLVAEPSAAWMPRMDIFEKGGHLVIKAELPGFKKEDVEVTLEGNDLIVRGESKADTEIKEEDYYRTERRYGSYYRRLPLGFPVEITKIEAKLTDGVLEVKVPKPAEATPEAKKIAVK